MQIYLTFKKIIIAILFPTMLFVSACKVDDVSTIYHCEKLAEDKSCESIVGQVCARQDTGIRCIRAPCNSNRFVEISNACSACKNPSTDMIFTGPCSEMEDSIISERGISNENL